MQRNVLFVSAANSAHLICELPRLFKKAGFRVTVLAFPHRSLKYSFYIDELIETSPNPAETIHHAARLVSQRTFHFTILASDALNWALVDSHIDPALKMQLSSIANPVYLKALAGKVESAQLWDELNILFPPSKAVCSLEKAAESAAMMGFPVILKVSRSGAGNGVFKCCNVEEVMKAPIPLTAPFLVQKYIEGDLIHVEALFLNSRLAAYSSSITIYCSSPYAPSLAREFLPCPEIEPILQTLGEKLQITGLANITFIREQGTQKQYLIETDFRPNRWVRHSELVGVDWSKALCNLSVSIQRPQAIRMIRHFPDDLKDAIRKKQLRRILYWLLNRDRSWLSLPYRDPHLLFGGCWALIRKMFRWQSWKTLTKRVYL